MAVSTDGQTNALRMTALSGAKYHVLADPDGATARSYRVFDLLGDGVATPATFIVDGDGGIRWYQVGVDIADRAGVQEIFDALGDS